jgi:hypothetical protein
VNAGVVTDVGELSLPPGDWDVTATVFLNSSDSASAATCWINDVSASQPDGLNGGLLVNAMGGLFVAASVGSRRWNVTNNTAIYASLVTDASSHPSTGYAQISARRMR